MYPVGDVKIFSAHGRCTAVFRGSSALAAASWAGNCCSAVDKVAPPVVVAVEAVACSWMVRRVWCSCCHATGAAVRSCSTRAGQCRPAWGCCCQAAFASTVSRRAPAWSSGTYSQLLVGPGAPCCGGNWWYVVVVVVGSVAVAGVVPGVVAACWRADVGGICSGWQGWSRGGAGPWQQIHPLSSRWRSRTRDRGAWVWQTGVGGRVCNKAWSGRTVALQRRQTHSGCHWPVFCSRVGAHAMCRSGSSCHAASCCALLASKRNNRWQQRGTFVFGGGGGCGPRGLAGLLGAGPGATMPCCAHSMSNRVSMVWCQGCLQDGHAGCCSWALRLAAQLV